METLMLSNLGEACFDKYRSTMCPNVQKLLKRTKERSSLNSYFNNNTAQIMWTGSELVPDTPCGIQRIISGQLRIPQEIADGKVAADMLPHSAVLLW